MSYEMVAALIGGAAAALTFTAFAVVLLKEWKGRDA